ncbi:MAG: hypothetical protein GQ574_04235 [Crocinitomix sp.]|nr:hypothetical protein [Crocinitomix sp.]
MKNREVKVVQRTQSKLVLSLAKSTGVDSRSVAAIVDKLGLETALQNRVYAAEHADKLGVRVLTIDQVRLEDMRIAVGDSPM